MKWDVCCGIGNLSKFFKEISRLFKHTCIIFPWFKILLLEWLYCEK